MTRKTPFWKYESCGNDFILVEDHQNTFPKQTQDMSGWVRSLCARKFGIGASGLLVLRKKSSEEFGLLFFDSLGQLQNISGSAAFCVSKHVQKTMVQISCFNQSVIVENLGKNWHSFLLDSPEKIELNQVFSPIEPPVHFVTLQEKHAVVFTQKQLNAIAPEMAQALSANISFVKKDKDSYKIITFCKNTQKFTLSSTSASAAVAIVCHSLHKESGPFTMAFSGGILQVELVCDQLEPKSLPKQRILGLPQLVYKGFGEHYENWNTEGSQRSRIPSWAYA